MTETRIEALEVRVRTLERLLQASVTRQPRAAITEMTMLAIADPGSPVDYALYTNNGNRATASNVSAAPRILGLSVPGRGSVTFGEIVDPTLRSTLLATVGINDLIYARSDNSGSNYLKLGIANDTAGATYTGGIVFNRPVGWFTPRGIFFMGCGIPTDLYETLGNGVNHAGTSSQISIICADAAAAPPRKLRLVKLTASNGAGGITFVQT